MKTEVFTRVGFIGSGRVTRFLVEGWQREDALPSEVWVTDPNREVVERLQTDFSAVQSVELSQVVESPLIILAVHPPDIKTVLSSIAPRLSTSNTLLSLAPKFTIASIQSMSGIRQVVRMIPNAPSAIGRGYNPVAYASEVTRETVAQLQPLFSPWGKSPEVPERDLEAYAILSAMGPTYMWFQWQTLRDLAVSFGLSREVADGALLATISASAELLLAHGKDPNQVIDMIPVKPLQPDEEAFRAAYCDRLSALYEKLSARQM
ncbi:MAG: NAD(P)-binding domain-containing protein [Acidobacteriota bacterium]|nr:MAG: NAD(P)-binding domain-containing protein [Acidobacteriota bacterium]